MTTICADELLRETAPARPAITTVTKPESVAQPRHVAPQAAVERPRPLRYEDFEQRTSVLGDLLGGQVFPRSV